MESSRPGLSIAASLRLLVRELGRSSICPQRSVEYLSGTRVKAHTEFSKWDHMTGQDQVKGQKSGVSKVKIRIFIGSQGPCRPQYQEFGPKLSTRDEVKNLIPGSPVTSQVRSNTKYWHFHLMPFLRKMPRINAKAAYESTWFGSVTYLSIVLSLRWPSLRSSEVTRLNCIFRSFGVVAHFYGSRFRLELEKWP